MYFRSLYSPVYSIYLSISFLLPQNLYIIGHLLLNSRNFLHHLPRKLKDMPILQYHHFHCHFDHLSFIINHYIFGKFIFGKLELSLLLTMYSANFSIDVYENKSVILIILENRFPAGYIYSGAL